MNSFLLFKLNIFYSEIGIDSHSYKKNRGRLRMLFYLVAIGKLSFCAVTQCHSQDFDIDVVKRDSSSSRRPQASLLQHIFLFPLKKDLATPDMLCLSRHSSSWILYKSNDVLCNYLELFFLLGLMLLRSPEPSYIFMICSFLLLSSSFM